MAKFLSSTIGKITIAAIAGAGVTTAIIVPVYQCAVIPSQSHETYHDYHFKYWRDGCESLEKLKSFVKETLNPNNKNFVRQDDRIATFDMDGTLFGERSPIYLEWMIYQDYFDNHFKGDKDFPVTYEIPLTNVKRKITLRDTYNSISKFKKGEEDKNLEMDEAYCGAQLFSRMEVFEYLDYVESYLQKEAENFNNLLYKDMFYLPMIEVVEYLQQNNFQIYIVSGTDRFMVRKIISQHLDIPWNKIIGMDVSLNQNSSGKIYRGPELKYKNVKKVKPELIMQEIGNWPILSFGNSSGDINMHEAALANPKYHHLAFMNVADDTVRERGYEGKELEERIKGWSDRFELFSMKNDWKTIYGDNVTLKK